MQIRRHGEEIGETKRGAEWGVGREEGKRKRWIEKRVEKGRKIEAD